LVFIDQDNSLTQAKQKENKMKTRAIVTLLLLALCMAIYASEDINDPEVYWRKTQEMNQMAERFKAETGFVGYIGHNLQFMKFSQMSGNFSGIQLTDPQDTTLAGLAIDQVLLRMAPFISAREGQLFPLKIESSQYSVAKKWEQRVNGYSVYPGGFIRIAYIPETQKFHINDSTADIPNTPIPINISKEDAQEIMFNVYKQSEFYDNRITRSYREPSIGYIRIPTSKDPLQYRLCWSLGFFSDWYCIDVETLEIYHDKAHDLRYDYAVKGKTYKPTISGLVFDPTNPPESPLKAIHVENGSEADYTDLNGIIPLSSVPQDNFTVSLRSTRWDIRSVYYGTNALNVHYVTEIDSMNYETVIQDTIDTQDLLNPRPPSLYAANIYYHLQRIDSVFTNLSSSFSNVNYPVIFNDNEALPANDWGGIFQVYPDGVIEIHYHNGYNPYIILHELSHFYTYNRMNSLTFSGVASTMLVKAMDEAFAEYWLGKGLDTNSFIRNYDGNSIAIDLLDMYNVQSSSIYNTQGLPLNEDFYSWYYCGMPIAAVWDNIRMSLLFDNFDSKLLEALAAVDENDQNRYKPRYFYNILMSNSTPAAQKIIDKAYSDRGLHFYPKVESYSGGNKSRNIYSFNDTVYVNITNAPQNTKIAVYLIRHGDYGYINGASVEGIDQYFPAGFSPIANVQTNAEGKWSGPLWVVSEDGEFDIIVDFGSPTTPDGHIYFAFNAANVRDGFDGLTEPGFTVNSDAIELAVALDYTSSMAAVTDSVVETAKSIIGHLRNLDKINIFGFGLDYNANNYPLEYIDKLVCDEDGGLATINCNKEELQAMIVGPIQPLATNMILPIEYAHSPFQASEAGKAMILLSDGWHWIREEDTVTPPYPNSLIHSESTTNYNPQAISCHTLCYEILQPQKNKTDGDPHMPYDAEAAKLLMQSIADWGNGQAYYRSSVDSSFIDITSLISDIRNKPPVTQKTGTFSETPVVDLSFEVDSEAHSLRIDYSLDAYTIADPISFELTSPSGAIYTDDSGIHNVYYRVGVIEIAYPENGLWSISLERKPNALELELFNISVELDSDIIIDFLPLSGEIPFDEVLNARAAVYNYKTPVTDAIITMKIQRGDWSVVRSLYDDGVYMKNQPGI
jgi:hypothetical protein